MSRTKHIIRDGLPVGDAELGESLCWCFGRQARCWQEGATWARHAASRGNNGASRLSGKAEGRIRETSSAFGSGSGHVLCAWKAFAVELRKLCGALSRQLGGRDITRLTSLVNLCCLYLPG